MEVGNLTEATCPPFRLGVNMSNGNNSFHQSDRSYLTPELASRLMNGDRVGVNPLSMGGSVRSESSWQRMNLRKNFNCF